MKLTHKKSSCRTEKECGVSHTFRCRNWKAKWVVLVAPIHMKQKASTQVGTQEAEREVTFEKALDSVTLNEEEANAGVQETNQCIDMLPFYGLTSKWDLQKMSKIHASHSQITNTQKRECNDIDRRR